MPIDQRRINGPEVSIPYSTYANLNKKRKCTILEELRTRTNSRKHGESRQMCIKLGVVSQAKGSAYIELDDTKVICSAYDPREIPNRNTYSTQGELFCEFKYASFSCGKRKVHQQDSEEREYSMIMQRALEPAVCRDEFPNFQVDIYALVLDNKGSALSAAITAASLALADASVPMFGIVAASTVAIYDDFFLLDPSEKEESLALSTDVKNKQINHGIIMQASMPQHDQISEFFAVGNLNFECIKKATEILENENKKIYPILKNSLSRSIDKALKKKKEEEEDL